MIRGYPFLPAVALGLSPDEPAIRVIRAAAALHGGSWEQATEHMTIGFSLELRECGHEVARLFYRACLELADKSGASAAVEQLTAVGVSDDLFTRYQIVIGTMME